MMNKEMLILIWIITVFCLGLWGGYSYGVQREFRRMNKAFQWAVKEKKQLERRVRELEAILWKCRHGGKGGIPIDYQEETDRLLATYNK